MCERDVSSGGGEIGCRWPGGRGGGQAGVEEVNDINSPW